MERWVGWGGGWDGEVGGITRLVGCDTSTKESGAMVCRCSNTSAVISEISAMGADETELPCCSISTCHMRNEGCPAAPLAPAI